MPRLIDLTGNKYGRLTVLSREENRGRQVRWLCKCECGNESIYYSTNLKRGVTKSCGCLRKEVLKDLKLEDLTGIRFNKLTVTKLSRYDEESRQYYWECSCDCGGKCVVYSGHLKSGHTTSCGCVTSYGEEKISYLLSNNNIDFIKQYKYDNLRGVNGGVLRFDFAVLTEDKTVDYLIEFDGWQHFIKSDTKWDRNGKFEERQENDRRKDEYCLDNGIKLLRIDYTKLQHLSIEDLRRK